MWIIVFAMLNTEGHMTVKGYGLAEEQFITRFTNQESCEETRAILEKTKPIDLAGGSICLELTKDTAA